MPGAAAVTTWGRGTSPGRGIGRGTVQVPGPLFPNCVAEHSDGLSLGLHFLMVSGEHVSAFPVGYHMGTHSSERGTGRTAWPLAGILGTQAPSLSVLFQGPLSLIL